MRSSSVTAALMIGIFTVLNAALAKPILDFNNESVYNSSFCKTQGCRFTALSYDSFAGIELDQYLYRLKNSLYFVVARWTPFVDANNQRFNRVMSVSLMARATTADLKQLEAFLPKFIDETAFGYHFNLKYDFKSKCAGAARAKFQEQPSSEPWDYWNFGFFHTIVLPGAENLTVKELHEAKSLVWDRKSLVIACTPQPFNMLSITLFWSLRYDWQSYSYGFRCSNLKPSFPECPWAYPKTVPMRIL